MSVWDIVNDITYEKNGAFNEKDYNAFLINRALSMHFDLVLFANEMNFYRDIPAKMQYDFLFHSVRARKRFGGKWPKRKEDSDVELVSRYYGFSHEKARVAKAVLTDEQLDQLRSSWGGEV